MNPCLNPGAGTVICLALLLLVGGRRLNAGEQGPAFDLEGPSGEAVRYAPPRSDREEAGKGVVTILLFMDLEQELSLKALADLRVCLEKTPGPTSGRRAFAVAVGRVEEKAAKAFGRLLPKDGPVRPALDPDRDVYADYGVIALPTTFLVDAGGSIALVLPGRPASYLKKLSAGLRKALGFEAVEKEEARRSPEEERAERLVNLAKTLAARGRFDAAAGQLRKAVELVPSDAGLQIRLGGILLRLDEGEAAAKAFGKALEAEPRSRPARIGRAKALSLGEDLEAGEEALRAELARGKADPDLFYYLGRLLERKGEIAEAARAYCEAYERSRAGN